MHFRVKRLIIEQLYKYKAEKIQTQLKEHALAISSALLAKTETVSQMIRDQELGDFLRSVDETTINVEHPAFNPLVTRLNHFKDESIYLSWIAVHHNEDTIDHNGRSRQAETRNGEERYKLANRKWYRETIESAEQPVVTLPVKDTSGSHVIAVSHRYDDDSGRCLGAVGIDFSVSALIRTVSSTREHFLVVTVSGDIIYNSKVEIAFVIERRNNIIMLFDKEVVGRIFANEAGYGTTAYDGKDVLITFCPIIKDKYYLIYIAH